MRLPTTPRRGASDSSRSAKFGFAGAREHNLKAVDVDIPRDRLVVITGLSGSGKSSLAFDTIFAEGQRKYIESLSAYARQFLDQQKKPDVESIEGLPPTIAIEQRRAGHNPRSTVATSTEIYDYLRLALRACGTARVLGASKKKRDGTITKRCEEPISSSHPSQITDAVSRMDEGTRLMVLAPVVRQRKGFHREVLEDLAKDGYVRARVNGEIVEIAEVLQKDGDNPLGLGRYEKHDIEAVVDRLVVRPRAVRVWPTPSRQRLRPARASSSSPCRTDQEAGHDHVYSERYACAQHPEVARARRARAPAVQLQLAAGCVPGRATALGVLLEFDEELVVPDRRTWRSARTRSRRGRKPAPAACFLATGASAASCRRFGVLKGSTHDQRSRTDEVREILLYGTTRRAGGGVRHALGRRDSRCCRAGSSAPSRRG